MATPASVKIPVRPDIPAFSEYVELDGVVYRLRFYWNDRLGTWLLDLRDASENAILLGIPIFTGYPLNYFTIDRIEGAPRGIFMVLDTTGQNQKADKDNFGKDVLLLYFSAA